MTERDLRGPAWVGTRTSSGAAVPTAGTWEVVDHADCQGNGTLRALGADDVAPRCHRCEKQVTWQLTHLAVTVASDHRGVGRLP